MDIGKKTSRSTVGQVQAPRPWVLLVTFLLSLGVLIYVLVRFPPGLSLSVLGLQISYLFLFFCLLFICIYSLSAFFLRSALQGILISGFIVCFFVFRLINLTQPLFIILLCILFLCVEAVVWRRK